MSDMKQWSGKYRPKTFEQVVENESAKARAEAIVTKKHAHAILIYGPSGCAKTTIGKIIAKSLTTNVADIKEENMSDKRGIDSIRSLINQSRFMAQGGSRVFLLDEVHALLGQAQSAILKTLEEPEHKDVVWIMCTDRPHALDSQMFNRFYKIECTKPSKEGLGKLLYRIAKKETAFPKLNEKRLQRLCLEVAIASDRVPRQAIQILQELSDEKDLYTDFKDLVLNGVKKVSESTGDKLVIQILMAMYSQEKSLDKRIEFLYTILEEKDVWGTVNRLVEVHHQLTNYLAGIRGAGYYHAKALEPSKAVPKLITAIHVSSELVQIRNNLATISTGIHHYVVPKLAELIIKLSK